MRFVRNEVFIKSDFRSCLRTQYDTPISYEIELGTANHDTFFLNIFLRQKNIDNEVIGHDTCHLYIKYYKFYYIYDIFFRYSIILFMCCITASI